MKTKTELYLIETKLNDSAKAAMRQIDLKDYPARFFKKDLSSAISTAFVWQCSMERKSILSLPAYFQNQ